MRIVLVSSPGRQRGPHWSRTAAAALAVELAVHGADVEWFCVDEADALPPVPAPGVRVHACTRPRPRSVAAVAAGMQHTALEIAMVRSLRAAYADAVVHLGAGAGGSPNPCWLAERMGLAAFAVVRSAEIACQRGDLRTAEGRPCERFDDAPTCAECCGRGRLRRPRADDFRTRWDLLLAGLAACETVFVEDDADRARLTHFGVRELCIVVGHDVAIVAKHLLVSPSPR